MKEALKAVVFFIVIIWLIEILNIFSGRSLVNYGILPRDTDGLAGIIFHPFIHGSISHLLSNTVPLLILGSIVAMEGSAKFFRISLFIILCGGFLLWLLGRSAFHIGASLLIFGYFGFIVVNAFYRRSLTAVLAALVTILLYGGLIYGLVPLDNRVSWEGHLFGFMTGIFAVRVVK